MPISFETDPRGLTHVTCEGVITMDEMRITFAQFMAKHNNSPEHRLIADLRAVTEIDLSFRDVFEMVVFVQTALRVPGVTLQVAIHAPRARDYAIAMAFAGASRLDRRISVSVHRSWANTQVAIGL